MKSRAMAVFAAAGLIICSVAGWIVERPADAAAAATPASAARADLLALQHQIRESKTLAFDTILISQGDSSTAVEVSGTFQRPNSFRLTATRNSIAILELACDGAKIIAYSPKSGHYYTCAAAADAAQMGGQTCLEFLSSEIGQAQAGSVVGLLAMLSDAVLVPPTPSIAGASVRNSTSESATMFKGLPATTIRARTTVSMQTGEGGSILAQLVYTKSPLSLKSYVLTVSQTGRPQIELIRLSFNRFNASTTPLNSSVFAYAPPPSAKLEAAQDIASAAAIGNALPPGSVAPDFTVQTPDGAPVKLSDYAGKVVVLDCWATWCGPCQLSLPQTDKIAAKYTPQGVVFMPVCVSDTKSNFSQWLPQHKTLSMKFLYDPAGQSSPGFSNTLYHVEGIPTQFVIGKDGKVVATLVGYDANGDPKETALTNAIDKAMATQ